MAHLGGRPAAVSASLEQWRSRKNAHELIVRVYDSPTGSAYREHAERLPAYLTVRVAPPRTSPISDDICTETKAADNEHDSYDATGLVTEDGRLEICLLFSRVRIVARQEHIARRKNSPLRSEWEVACMQRLNHPTLGTVAREANGWWERIRVRKLGGDASDHDLDRKGELPGRSDDWRAIFTYLGGARVSWQLLGVRARDQFMDLLSENTSNDIRLVAFRGLCDLHELAPWDESAMMYIPIDPWYARFVIHPEFLHGPYLWCIEYFGHRYMGLSRDDFSFHVAYLGPVSPATPSGASTAPTEAPDAVMHHT